MERLFELSKWLIIFGIIALVIVGIVAWAIDPGEAVTIVVTPTVVASPTAQFEEPTVPPSPTPTFTPTPVPPTWTSTPTPTETPTPTSTPTPTPTETPTPAPIALPGRGPLPEIASTPVITLPLPQPSPMPVVSQPAGTVNILLLGMDRQGGEGIARTDVLVVASIFPDIPAVSLLSIPRDYYAWIPAWGLDKINTAYLRGAKRGYPGGGPELAMTTIEYNFGIPIHYYALVDFGNYSKIVDAVGGVDIIVECPFHDTYPDTASETGQTDIDLEPGLHHLNGKFALWYVRSRWNTSDFDRHRRQQQVLMAIFQQAMNQNMLVRLPELWDVYKESVETDLGLKELVFLASVARRLDSRDVHNYFVRGDSLIHSWTAPNGGYVLVPELEAMQDFVQGVMRPLSTSRASQRSYRVIVSNGSWAPSWGEVAAYRLALEGFDVVGIEEAEHTPNTQVIDYTMTSKGSPLPRLLSLYRLNGSSVVKQPLETSEADFRVVLGGNYNPCYGTTTAYWRATPTPMPTPISTPTPPPAQ